MAKKPTKRYIIIGPPFAGKSTLMQKLMAKGYPAFCTDSKTQTREVVKGVTYLQDGLEWSEASQYVADNWLGTAGPWVVEGVAALRAVRKMIRQGNGAALKGAEIIVLSFMHYKDQDNLKEGHFAMNRAFRSMWAEIGPLCKGLGIVVHEGETFKP